MSFLNDIIDNKFIIDFDFQYNSTGTNRYPSYRRIIWWYPFDIELTSNYILLMMLGVGTGYKTTNKYNDMLWHHMTIFVDLNTKTFTMSIDNGVEILSIAISSALDPTMYLGHKDYGLNGYIRNFVITTTNTTIPVYILFFLTPPSLYFFFTYNLEANHKINVSANPAASTTSFVPWL